MSDAADPGQAAGYGSRQWLDQAYRRVGSDPWGLEWRPSQVERYHRMIEVVTAAVASRGAAPRQALDVGCATGTFTAMLADALAGAGTEVRGSDLTELAIARARTRYPALAFDCLTIDEAADRFAGQMDVVTMLEVIYYLPAEQRAGVLASLRRMLRPGGLLLVSSMIARQPYMSAPQLRELVGSTFTIVDAGVLELKPLALLEKPLLRLAPLLDRLRRAGRPGASALPARPRAARAVARLGARLLGQRALSHSYVVGAVDGRPA